METQIWHLPASSVGWREAAPPSLAWCQTIHFLPVCPWCLLSSCPSAGAQREVSLSKSFNRNAWDSRSLHLTQPQSLLVLHPEVMGLLLLALELWAGGPGVQLGPINPQGLPLQPRYPSQFLSTTCGCGTSPSVSLSLQPVSCDFFNPLDVGLPFSQISGGSEWWLCSLVIILIWL